MLVWTQKLLVFTPDRSSIWPCSPTAIEIHVIDWRELQHDWFQWVMLLILLNIFIAQILASTQTCSTPPIFKQCTCCSLHPTLCSCICNSTFCHLDTRHIGPPHPAGQDRNNTLHHVPQHKSDRSTEHSVRHKDPQPQPHWVLPDLASLSSACRSRLSKCRISGFGRRLVWLLEGLEGSS